MTSNVELAVNEYHPKIQIVEAVQITKENIKRVAQWSGSYLYYHEASHHKLQQDDGVFVKSGDDDVYISFEADNKDHLIKARPGDWLVKYPNGDVRRYFDSAFKKFFEIHSNTLKDLKLVSVEKIESK